jgi:hypothetical protein
MLLINRKAATLAPHTNHTQSYFPSPSTLAHSHHLSLLITTLLLRAQLHAFTTTTQCCVVTQTTHANSTELKQQNVLHANNTYYTHTVKYILNPRSHYTNIYYYAHAGSPTGRRRPHYATRARAVARTHPSAPTPTRLCTHVTFSTTIVVRSAQFEAMSALPRVSRPPRPPPLQR